ncbi:MAG: aquaporin [Bacteroidota bacterium]
MFKIIAEGIGTLFLVLAIGLSADPVVAGLIYILLLYICYPAWDAHLNPAVSIGAWTSGRDGTGILINRLLGQFIGAGAGGWLTFYITGIPVIPGPSSSTGVVEFIFLELAFSALFVLLFLVMIYPKNEKRNGLFGLVIGAGFAGCLIVVEPISGLGLHPAFNTAFTLIDYLQGGSSYVHLPVYLFGPLVAAIVAGLVHRKTISNKKDEFSGGYKSRN